MASYLNRNGENTLLATTLAPSVARQKAQEGKEQLVLGRSFYISVTELTPISAIVCIIGKYLLERKRNQPRKQQSTQIEKQSDTVVRHEDDKCSAKPGVGRRKRYKYFERLTIIRLIRVLSVNMCRLKEKGNDA